MSQRLKAIYHDGAFIPQTPVDVPENAEVELIVQGPYSLPAVVTNPEQRDRILRLVLRSMRHNPLPAGAPRFKREELHERS